MRLSRLLVLPVAIGLLMSGGAAQVKEAQAEDVLERRLCGERPCNLLEFFEEDDVSDAMYLAFSFADQPGGVAFLPDFAEKPKYKFTPASLRMKDVLDSVVAAEPRYRWEVDNGIINLLPVEQYPLLNYKISQFQMENATVKEMLAHIKQMPEFRTALASLNISELPPPSGAYGFFIISGGKPVDPKKRYSISCADLTLRQLLNAVVRRDGCAVWSYVEWKSLDAQHAGEQYYKLDLLDYCTEAVNTPR